MAIQYSPSGASVNSEIGRARGVVKERQKTERGRGKEKEREGEKERERERGREREGERERVRIIKIGREYMWNGAKSRV